MLTFRFAFLAFVVAMPACKQPVPVAPVIATHSASPHNDSVINSVSVHQQAEQFFSPLQPNGQIDLGRCHMGYCSWAKWIAVKSLPSSGAQQALEIKLLGGESEHEKVEDYPRSPQGVSIKWNLEPHIVKVICSRTAPSVSNEILLLNPETGIPGVQESAAELYFVACHSHFDGYPEGIQKFSYNVKERP
ncbi:MAG: hypothetical protein LBV45_03445 [Xanthomonadaceae bacterium]|jgi:hypothetical protein|nr:hypothetical protein [Xanthomonadaceae bacterium]